MRRARGKIPFNSGLWSRLAFAPQKVVKFFDAMGLGCARGLAASLEMAPATAYGFKQGTMGDGTGLAT